MGKETLKLFAKILTHIPDDSDVSLVVLKGHLIIEEKLNAALAKKTENSKYIKNAKLEFAQLLSMTKSFYFSSESSWVWGAVKKLNLIRNQYAHNLEPSKVDKKIEEFILLVESNIGAEKEDLQERLRRCLAMLAANVRHMYETKEA